MQDFEFPFHEGLFGPSLQLVEVPLKGDTAQNGISAANPSFISSAALLRVYSIPSSRLLMKMFTTIGPSIDLWGTPLATGLQLDFVLLITTL